MKEKRLIDANAIPWDVAGIGEIPVVTKEEIDAMKTEEPDEDTILDYCHRRCLVLMAADAFEELTHRHQRPHGIWIQPRKTVHSFKCTWCGKYSFNTSPYCQNCGAEMNEVER